MLRARRSALFTAVVVVARICLIATQRCVAVSIAERGPDADRLDAVDLFEQQHVVRVDHRGVGRGAVRRPRLPGQVEVAQRPTPGVHVREPPEPGELVGAASDAELAENVDSDLFLGLDEFGIEDADELVPSAGVKQVSAELENGAVVGHVEAPCQTSSTRLSLLIERSESTTQV